MPATSAIASAAGAGARSAGAGGGGGSYQLGNVEVAVANGVPVSGDGVLAGTVLTMLDAVRNLHALGVPFEQAVGAATDVPARIIGRRDLGVLEPGARADVVVLDDRLEIARVLAGGEAYVVA
jgi:N-acetylglucosamine-6-phosphate deacetylase